MRKPELMKALQSPDATNRNRALRAAFFACTGKTSANNGEAYQAFVAGVMFVLKDVDSGLEVYIVDGDK